MKRIALSLSLILLVSAGHALAGAEYDKEIARQFEPGSVQTVKLHNLAGRVLLERSGSDALELRAVIRSNDHDGMSAREVAQLLDLDIRRDGDTILVKAEYPVESYDRIHYSAAEGSFFSSSTTVKVDGEKVKISTGRKGSGLPLWVDFQLRVPDGLASEVRNYVGNVKVEGVKGDCKLDCASADISVEDFEGTLNVDTGSGDIDAEKIAGRMLLDTGSGDIKVADMRGDFRADTGSGDILLRNAEGERFYADTGSGDVIMKDVAYPSLGIDTGSGDVKVSSLIGLLRRWEVDTGSGDVVFVIPQQGANFRLEVDTSSGEVDCQLATSDIRQQRGKIRSLTVGRGEGLIVVDTGSGDLSILQRDE